MGDVRAALPVAPPAAVRRIVERLERAGFEAWCVGGAVRDALLGHAHLDWDVATSARPEEVRRIFRRTVPVGIEFGTVGVLDDSGRLHEVTTFRRDVRTDGRHAEVEFGVSLDDDLARRDFTINALAYSPSRDELRDPFGGQRDLAAHLVRAVGDPNARMREDRLRALRGIRFAARFGFALEPATWDAIVASAPHLGRLSAERVRQEIEKTLDQVVRPSAAFALWRSAGAFASLVPPLAQVTDDALAVVDCLTRPGLKTRPARRVLRMAALVASLAPDELPATLRALRFSNQDARVVSRVVAGWRALGDALTRRLAEPRPVEDVELRRWIVVTGRTDWMLVQRLAAAVWSARRDRRGSPGDVLPSARAVRAVYRRGLRVAYRDPLAVADLAVDGDDLRTAGVPPGRAMGETLAALLEAVVERPELNTRDALLGLVRARATGG